LAFRHAAIPGFGDPINSSLIAAALVPIATAMHVSVGKTTVLVTALYLASSIAQPTGGKLAEEFVFLAGIVIVLVGGLIGGLGQNLTMLVVSRVLIGVGTSGGYPSAMLLIRRRAQQAGLSKPPGNVLGGLLIAGSVTAALGLPMGGVLVDAWGWRTVFFVNVPVTAVTLLAAIFWISKDAPIGARQVATRIDAAGIVGFGGAMTALLVFLFSLPNPNWPALVLVVVLGFALVLWELRARNPFLDIRLLASNLPLTRTYLRFGLLNMCVYTVLYGVTEWLESARGISTREAGLLLLPLTGVAALLISPISRRNLVRGPLIIAAVSSVAGSVGVLLFTTHTPLLAIIAVTLIFGLTLSLTATSNQTALYGQAPAATIGTASGLYRTFGYVGSIASSAVISITFHHSVDDHHLHVIAVIMIAISGMALLMTVADRRLPRSVRPPKTTNRDSGPKNTPHNRRSIRMTTEAVTPIHVSTAPLSMDYQNGIIPVVPNPANLLLRHQCILVTAADGSPNLERQNPNCPRRS
jgi:MFS family permease